MMRSMYSGVSGLRVHQTKMDVIGNNIANVNTVGYKSQRVTFNDVFSQTIQSASGASDETGRGGRNPMQVGLGVNVSSVDMLMKAGAAQRTDNPFDLMVDGNGFIVVGDNTGTYFTRAGALRMDDDGNLTIPNGMKVKGWQADDKGENIIRGEVQDINLNKFKTAEPAATSKIEIMGNLNTADSPITTQIKFYDSLGNFYNTNVKMTYDPATSKWTAAPITVNKDGVLDTDGAKNTFLEITDQNGKKYGIDNGADKMKPFVFEFDATGKYKANTNKFEMTTLNLQSLTTVPYGTGTKGPLADVSAISIDLSKLTQYSAKTNVDPKPLNGRAPGKLSGYDIGGDGIITAYYDNGDRKVLAQVVTAEFANPAGLEKAGSNLFKTTTNSGDFDNIGKAANFQAGVLEMSNVDLSMEFTEMITTQRGFQANSKIIGTSDEMLQELVNIKR